MTGLSLSILSAEKSQCIQLPTFSSCGAHIRSGKIFFLLKLQRQQCACNGPLVFVNQGGGGLESEPVGGEILLFWGGGVNEFQVIIGMHRLSSCTTGRDIERNDKVCQKFIGYISK